MTTALLGLAIALAACSGVPGLLCRRDGPAGQTLATALLVTAGLLAIAAACLVGASQFALAPSWLAAVLGLDAVQRWFLLPVAVIGPLAAVYGQGYWPQARHPENGRKLRLFFGLLIGASMLVVGARHTLVFLFGWEAMALSAFLLVGTEDDDAEVRAASWLYLAAAHFGTLALFALFAVMHRASGSFDFALPAGMSPGMADAVFLLALLGFGLKAGVVPVHVWLPGAHAAAPGHVSAVLSGMLLKMGVFGLVRMTGLFTDVPTWWGGLVGALGTAAALLGVVSALGQHDIKRLLAYHSVENIGIIFMGLGIALLGRSSGRPEWVALGLAGALLHVWNHALFKSLLFLCAGAVVHATHTRTLDHLGGLAKRMPWTTLAFLVGAVAICGLPPLNGFVSEFLVYLGLFGLVTTHVGRLWLAGGLAATVLALVGALALACFVKVLGVAFLGTARTDAARHATEATPSMLWPMAILAALCLGIGLGSPLLMPWLDAASAAWAPGHAAAIGALAPLGTVSAAGGVLLGLLALTAAGLIWAQRRGGITRAVTWDCGYAAPGATMQYTASSFAQQLTGLFSWALAGQTHFIRPSGVFPGRSAFHRHVTDPVLDGVVWPAVRGIAGTLARLHALHGGRSQAYFVYMILTLFALLLW